MNQWRKPSWWVAGVVIALLPRGGLSAESPISKQQIAELMEYPSANLLLTDETHRRNEAAQRKNRPLAISAHLFTTADSSFAPMTVTVGEAGTLLTVDSNIGPATGFRKFDLKGLGSAYAGFGSFGPGGDNRRVLATLPAARKDILITLMIPGDGQLVRIPEGERHYELLSKSPELTERLVKCVEITAQAIASVEKAPKQETIRSTSKDGDTSGGRTSGSITPATSGSRSGSHSMTWWWTIVAALGLGVVILLLAHWKRRDSPRKDN